MHELSLAGGILKLVEDCAAREGFACVTQLRLAAPALSGVDVRALRFALESLQPGTVLDGAGVLIEQPASQAWCLPCARTIELTHRIQPCPHCGRHQLQVTGGTELQVIDLRVRDAVPAVAAASTLPVQE